MAFVCCMKRIDREGGGHGTGNRTRVKFSFAWEGFSQALVHHLCAFWEDWEVEGGGMFLSLQDFS